MKLLNDLLEDHAEITRLFQQVMELGITTEQVQDGAGATNFSRLEPRR